MCGNGLRGDVQFLRRRCQITRFLPMAHPTIGETNKVDMFIFNLIVIPSYCHRDFQRFAEVDLNADAGVATSDPIDGVVVYF